VYRKKAKYCVMLVSENYAKKRRASLECKAAQARAFEENRPYILPIRLDSTEIPGVLPTVGYMSWDKDGISFMIDAIEQKLRQT